MPLEYGLLGLGGYLKFWGIVFLLCDLWLIFLKKENIAVGDVVDDVGQVYKTIWQLLKMDRKFKLILKKKTCNHLLFYC